MSPDPRLDRIEERIAWLERHVAQQDKAMLELAQENDRLKQQLRILQLKAGSGPGGGGAGELLSPADERPPHY